MRSIFMMAIFVAFALGACDREERPDVGQVAPLQDVPAVKPQADMPGEHPPPSVRTYPTGEIPDDPHLARGYRVYRDGCMVCHDRGAANAPPLTDVAEWRKRIAKGRETLYRNSIKGFTGARGFMPPKGGSPGARSDEDVRAAVDYMLYVVDRLQ